MLTETAFAKLNLALHVRQRRADGYHELETLFAFCADGDALTVEAANGFRLSISGPFAEGLSASDDNLILRAAQALAQAHGLDSGAHFHLTKNLPVASGIGGGSADAAAALRLCALLWGLKVGAIRDGLATSLGADVPACVASQTCFGTGVGDVLEPIEVPQLSGAPVLLVNPRVACPTGPVFKAWDGVDRGPLDPHCWAEGRNDLQTPATALVPIIADVLAALTGQAGARATRMSGSGATCFALFDRAKERDAAAAAIVTLHPGWWVLPTCLR